MKENDNYETNNMIRFNTTDLRLNKKHCAINKRKVYLQSA